MKDAFTPKIMDMEFTENAKGIRLSERTREMLIALAAFNESFWKVSELLTDKSDDETSQEALEGVAYKEQKAAMEYQAKVFNEMENLVKELGLEDRVIFAGFVPDDELPKYYNAADIAVSASKFETQGLSILEAMASGKTVACRNGRAFTEIVHNCARRRERIPLR